MDAEGTTSGGLWRHRGRRWAAGVNTGAALLLALVVLGMVNYLAHRHLDLRRDLSARTYYRLSDKTAALFRSLEGTVHVVVLFQHSHPRFRDIRNLLKEYEYEAARAGTMRLEIEFVDPDRDLARTRELARKYDVSEANVVAFEYGGRRKYVGADDLVDFEVALDKGRAFKRMTGFRGEQAFSSAIQSVAQAATPTVFFLVGHGEHDIEESSQPGGYAKVARLLRRDNVEVQPLLMAQHRGIPTNCSALIVAGPSRALPQAEIDMLSDYLNRNGRVLFMLDAGVTTGLEKMLEAWGVKLAQDVVVGLTLTGRELVVANYGNHPVTRLLRKVTTLFYAPRSVEPIWNDNAAARADRPLVSILAINTANGWAETDPTQSPPRFDADADRRGPISVAVAVEKGLQGSLGVAVKPTRLIVIGDSAFVSNGALTSGIGGNTDLFLSAVNWLTEEEQIITIDRKILPVRRLILRPEQVRFLHISSIGLLPLLLLVIGGCLWWRRR